MSFLASRKDGAALFVSRPRLQDGARAVASPLALVGISLILCGILGIAAYLACSLPPFVQFCSMVVLAGTLLVMHDLGVADELPFGVTPAELVASAIHSYKAFWSQFMLLLAIPDITAADISIVLQGLASDADEDPVLEESRTGLQTNGVACNGYNNAHTDPLADQPAHNDSFAVASNWLQQSHLTVGLVEQLQLYGLFRRAQGDQATDSSAHASDGAGGWLVEAKAEALCAYRNLAVAEARAQLAPALAEADPCFVAAYPQFAPPPRGGQWGMIVALVERRLPQQLSQHVASAHRRLLAISAALTSAAVLRAVMLRVRRSTPRQVWGWICAALCGSTTSAYLLALVKGLPLAWHVEVARRCELRPLMKRGGGAGHAVCRLEQYLRMLLVPRIHRPLLAE